jgi:TadE-like protein
MSGRVGSRGVRPRPDHGQSTVELALALPMVVMLLLLIIQVAVVSIDQVRVVHAAREAARRAAVDGDRVTQVAVTSAGLEPGRATVTTQRNGDLATVRVTYRSPTEVPLVGWLVGDVDMTATASMRFERTGIAPR